MSANWRLLWVPIAWAALIAVAVGLTRSGLYGLVLFALLPILIETEKATSVTKPNSIAVDRYDMQNLDMLRSLSL